MRVVTAAYTLTIAAGLVVYVAIGLLHR